MRVSLSHAMTSTFLDTVRVNTDDITKLLAKYNTEYSLELNEEAIDEIIKSEGCPYDDYFNNILNNLYKPKGVGTVKVVLIYKNGNSLDASQGVEFKLNIPFKSVRKTLYVNIVEEFSDEKISNTTRVFIVSPQGFKFVDVQNGKIFNVKSSIGIVLSDYYKMWRVKEAFLSRVYSKFTQHVPYMFFTSVDEQVGM